MDVTGRKQDEERLGLLTREVDHRANNLLAVIQGLVSLSTGDKDPALRQVLLGRIAALGHAHKLLAEARWTGADLLRLVQEELKPYGLDQPNRVRLRGRACSLSPAQAQAISMALHELATNAAKYGALSVAEGGVCVDWTVRSGCVELLWEENGGPLVKPPAREGLGSRILQRALGGSIGGSVIHEWPREGHRCRIVMPLTPGDAKRT
jgi:two-component sensor histidine kinase